MKALEGLSVRTANALARNGYRKRKQILHGIKSRALHPSNVKALGFGWKALAETRAWLGLKPDLTDKDICRHRARICQGLFMGGLTVREVGVVMRMTKGEAERYVHKGQTKPTKCRQCGSPAVKESDAEGYACTNPQCASTDSDE